MLLGMKTFKTTTITKIQKKFGIILALTTLLMGTVGFIPAAVSAATYMTHASVIETNMNTGGSSQVYVAFTAGAADAASNFTVNFAGWTGGANGIVNTVQPLSTTTCQALTGATNVLPGTLAATGATSVVTVTGATALTSGSSYCFELSSATAVTNPTSVGQSTVTLTSVTTNDTATVAIDNIANDQVTVTATVPPTFTLALSGNNDAFTGNLSSGATAVTTGVTATINTNATTGWGIWAVDSQAGLRSPSEAHTIATVATTGPHTFTTGTEQYGLGVATDPTTNYAYGGGTTGSGLSTTVYNEIATAATPASGVTTVIHELADVSATTQAAQDYSDVITLVGAGSF
jgi:hypothetical protein